MKADTILDYALFELSQKHSRSVNFFFFSRVKCSLWMIMLSMLKSYSCAVCYRCELFVSSNGETEKLASGLIEPFVNHLSVLEAQSYFRAELKKSENEKSWFTRRTLERFLNYILLFPFNTKF